MLSANLLCAGYAVDACETDYGSIISYNYLFDTKHTSRALQHTLHPWITQWTHQLNPSARFRPIQFPDVLFADRVRLVDGDFLTQFQDENASYDALVTLFFIDVSEDVIAFLEEIHRLLKPGGLWINLGRTFTLPRYLLRLF